MTPFIRVGRRKLEPSVAETKRWAVEGTCFGLNWIEVERASHATKKAALADMRAIAKKMPHLQLRVVAVVERRDVVERSGAKPPNDPSSATRRTGRNDCNHDAPAGFAAAHRWHERGWASCEAHL